MNKKPIFIVFILGIFIFNLTLNCGVVCIKDFYNASGDNALIKIFDEGKIKKEVKISAYNSAKMGVPVSWIDKDNMAEPSKNYVWIQTKAGIYNVLQGNPYWHHKPRPDLSYCNGDGVYIRGPGYDNIQKINKPTQGSKFSLLVDKDGILKKAKLNDKGKCEDFKFNFGFLATSDTHFTDDPSKALYPAMRAKINLIPQMINCINSPLNVKTVLMLGDLIDGHQNDSIAEKSTKKFKEVWYNPLKKAIDKVNGKGVFLSPGNHDWDTRGVMGWPEGWPYKYPKPIDLILKTTKDQLGIKDYYYSFDIGNVHFACPGVYPADDEGEVIDAIGAFFLNKRRVFVNCESLEWLEKDLRKKTYPGQPIVIFFHYSLTGFASGGSKKSEKDAFEKLIKDNNYNVKAIINGHTHFNDSNFWRGIWQINVSGDKFGLITYEPDNDELKMTFVDKNGNGKDNLQSKPVGMPDGEEQHASEESQTNRI